tara:strand:+ start:4463 stop:4780 length:318 start_codon:yes stop_codon:yes gene_type:complete
MKTTTRIDEKTGDKHITVDIGSEYTYGDWTLYKTADIEAQIRKTPGCDLEGYVFKEGTRLLAKHLGKSVGTYVFSKNKTETVPVKQDVSKTQTSRKKKNVINKEG